MIRNGNTLCLFVVTKVHQLYLSQKFSEGKSFDVAFAIRPFQFFGSLYTRRLLARGCNKYLFQYPENFYSDLAGTEKLAGKDVYVLTLKPRESGYVNSAKLWVGKDDWIIKKIYISTDESTSTYTVKNVQLNVGLSNSKFSFSPPEGTEVIDMR